MRLEAKDSEEEMKKWLKLENTEPKNNLKKNNTFGEEIEEASSCHHYTSSNEPTYQKMYSRNLLFFTQSMSRCPVLKYFKNNN
jgi:hypothetical protein